MSFVSCTKQVYENNYQDGQTLQQLLQSYDLWYVDIDRILQIVIGETPIFVNVIASVPKVKKKESFDVFASNPKNKKFFKK